MNNLTKFYNKLTNEQIDFCLSNFQFQRLINRSISNESKLGNWKYSINKKDSINGKGHKFTKEDYNILKEIIDAGYTSELYSDYLQVFDYDFKLVESFKNYPQLKRMYYNAVSIMSFRSLRDKHLTKFDRKKYFDVLNDEEFPYENFMKNHFVNKQIFKLLIEFKSEMKPHLISNIENTFNHENPLNIIYSSILCSKKLTDIPMNNNEYNYYISGTFDSMLKLFTTQEIIWIFRYFNDFEQIDSYEMFNFLKTHNKQINYVLSKFDNYHDFKVSVIHEPEDIV